MSSLNHSNLRQAFGDGVRLAAADKYRPEGVFVPNVYLDTVGLYYSGLTGAGWKGTDYSAGYGLQVHWPYPLISGERQDSPQTPFDLSLYAGILESMDAWMHGGDWDQWAKPNPAWEWFAKDVHWHKSQPAYSGGNPIFEERLAVRRWSWEHALLTDQINAAFALAHQMGAWDKLDKWYPLVWDRMGRYVEPFGKDGESEYLDAGPWLGFPADWVKVRDSWQAGFADDSHLNDWVSRATKREEKGLPTPILTPFVRYSPHWWIVSPYGYQIGLHNGLGSGADLGWPKAQIGWKEIEVIDVPDTADIIGAVFKQLIISAMAAAVAAGAAESLWQGFGAPGGEFGLDLTTQGVGGGLDATMTGDNIGEGILSGLGDSLDPSAIAQDLAEDMGWLDNDWLDEIGNVVDEIGEYVDVIGEIDSIADVIGAFGGSPTPEPTPQTYPTPEDQPELGGLTDEDLAAISAAQFAAEKAEADAWLQGLVDEKKADKQMTLMIGGAVALVAVVVLSGPGKIGA